MDIVKSSTLEAAVREMAALSDSQLDQAIEGTKITAPEPVLKSTTEPSEVWFPVTVNLPSNNTAPTTTPGALTEEEKRKRLIIVMGSLFAALILFIIIMAMRANKA